MTQRTKILYVITKSNWGGAQRYVYDLATRMDAGRFDVAVACGPSTHSTNTQGGEQSRTTSSEVGPLVERLRSAGVRTVTLPHLERDVRLLYEPVALRALYRLYREERPDVIHLSSSKAGGLGAAAALLYKTIGGGRGCRTIFTVHGWPFYEDRPRWQRIAIFLASWLSVVLADRIIVITTADYRAGRRFIPEEKLVLIFHGIGPFDALPRPAARSFFAEQSGGVITAGTALIGTVAELTANKGLLDLIAAFVLLTQRMPAADMRLLITGEGEDRERLRLAAASAGLSDRVWFLGFVPEVRRYLAGLDCFVLPSVKEGLPYAAMEAMAAGVPIVASRVGGIPDLIQDGETGLLVEPRSPAALEGAIGRVLADRGLRNRIGRRAREAMARSFPLDAMIERVGVLYAAA